MNTGTSARVWRMGRAEVATTSIFTVCSPRGVPDVLSFERRWPLGVTTAPVPVCRVVVVVWCAADPQPAANTATAAIQVVRTGSGYPGAMAG
jgi:hypothetical protein